MSLFWLSWMLSDFPMHYKWWLVKPSENTRFLVLTCDLMVAEFLIRSHWNDTRLQGPLVNPLQEHIYQLFGGRRLILKVESVAKAIAYEDTECIFPHVILWMFCFGDYHVPSTSLFLLPITLSRYLCGRLAVCRCPLPNTAALLMRLVLAVAHHPPVTSLWAARWQPPARSSSKVLQRWDAGAIVVSGDFIAAEPWKVPFH